MQIHIENGLFRIHAIMCMQCLGPSVDPTVAKDASGICTIFTQTRTTAERYELIAEIWRGDSRVYGGLGLGTGAKAHPDQYFSKKKLMKIF